MPAPDPAPESGPAFTGLMTIDATAHATHPDGAVLPAPAAATPAVGVDDSEE